jgi:hypothetical protein
LNKVAAANLVTSATAGEIFDPGDPNGGVEERLDKQQRPYFYNRKTGKSGWSREDVQDHDDLRSEMSLAVSETSSNGFSAGANPIYTLNRIRDDQLINTNSTQVRRTAAHNGA